eukprot:scaffold1807_cov140-Cylindrotheca_fusiformis.AAC.18
MLFKTTILALLFAAASAQLTPDGSIPADSKAGMSLMSQARKLDQNNNQDDDDVTWMAGYSIKYLGCSSLLQVREEGGGEEESNLFTMNMVKFGLCPSDKSCNSCGNGKAQYVVNMEAFVNAYTEMKMNKQEQACENVRENCNCDNANDDEACENQCYEDAGLSDCIEYEGDEEFDAQEYLECRELEGANNGNGNNYYNNNNGVNMYQQYFVGPTCSNGFKINLATFYDNGCSQKTKSGVYEAFNYGQSLPFEKESMVSGDCVSCMYVEEDENNNNGGNNNNQDYEILELCEESYEEAAKCESGLSGVKSYPDESGCDYINNVLPKLVKATSSITKARSKSRPGGGGSSAATGWAIFFFLTAAVFTAYSFFLYRKIHRAKVNLAAGEGELA